jgi:hypothetical protein
VCTSSFALNLEKTETGAETFEMLKTAFGDESWLVLACLNGLRVLKKAELPSMMIHNPGDHQQAEMMILWHMWELICANRLLTVHEISAEVGISNGMWQAILTGFEHATHFCGIRSSCPHHRAEGTPLVCSH